MVDSPGCTGWPRYSCFAADCGVDWYLGDGDLGQASILRREVGAYLSRHAGGPEGVDEAELIVQEVVTNALKHAGGPVWVQLTWLDHEPTLVVRDLGPGFRLDGDAAAAQAPLGEVVAPGATAGEPPETADVADLPEGGRGVMLVSHLTNQLVVAARRGGGARVEVRLPVHRAPSPSIDVRRPVSVALPALEEAEPEGAFGRESFLRALAVQLVQAAEALVDPGTAEHLVAQVGVAVGGQMEAEYRAAKRMVERLTPAHLADCFVRLKHAIDGRFSVVEVTESRIVLANTRCPFGDAVRKAPALCRMTSGVFGGIAAGNHEEGASVVLEERIAVGDPGCRVVVYLGDPPEGTRAFAHRYVSGTR